MAPNEEHSFVMFKPLAVAKNLVPGLKRGLMGLGVEFEECKPVRVTRSLIAKHYRDHRNKPFFEDLLDYYDGKSVQACRVGGPRGTILKIRRKIGPSDPVQCTADHLRAQAKPYAATGETCGVDNLIHASDSPRSAQRELTLWGLAPRRSRMARVELVKSAGVSPVWDEWVALEADGRALDKAARKLGMALKEALRKEGVQNVVTVEVQRPGPTARTIWFLPDSACIIPVYIEAGDPTAYTALAGGSKGRVLGSDLRQIARNLIRLSQPKVASYDPLDVVDVVFEGHFPSVKTAGVPRYQAVFLMGLPGAGKSTYKARTYLKYTGFKDIEPDMFKRMHPDYDPLNMNSPAQDQVHFWSLEEADKLFARTLRTGDSFVLDGTGTYVKALIEKIKQAKAAGYRTFLVYVYVPPEVALFRNRSRAAKGGHFIPEEVILRKAKQQDAAFAQARRHVDRFKVVPKYTSKEERLALQDLRVYPPPQPVVPPRPGDPDYGV